LPRRGAETWPPAQRLKFLVVHETQVRNLAVADREFKFEFSGNDEEVVKLHQELMRQDIPLVWFHEEEADLEEAFMKITQGLVA
jgi:hypothetical protein